MKQGSSRNRQMSSLYVQPVWLLKKTYIKHNIFGENTIARSHLVLLKSRIDGTQENKTKYESNNAVMAQ